MISAFLRTNIILFSLAYLNQAFATTADDIKLIQENINNTERRLEEQTKEDIDRGIGNKGGYGNIDLNSNKKKKKKKKSGANDNCINVNSIEYEGGDSLPSSFKNDIEHEYLNKCLTAIDIESVMSLLVNWFISEGFSTTRVYLEAQNLTAGILKLRVQDGIISDIILEDNDQKSIYLPSLFPFMKGKLLELPKIEQGINQANKQRSNRTVMEIVSGENPGDSIVVVKNEKIYPINLNFSIDNHGSTSTGKIQGATTITADNFIGINDIFTLTHRESISEIYINHPGESVSDSVAVVIPFGFFTHTYTLSKSKYESDIITPAGSLLVSSGESTSSSLTIDRVIYRNADTIANSFFTLRFNRSKNYLNGSYLDISSNDRTTGIIGASINSRLFNNPISFSLSFTRGLTLFGADEAIHNLPENLPKNLYTKVYSTLTYVQQFQIFSQRITLNSSLNGQYAFDNLPSSQRISIGSTYSVRGYLQNSLSGDNGGYIRNDIIWNNPLKLQTIGINTRLSASYDMGWVKNRYDLGNGLDGKLSGGSLGLTIFWKNMSATFTYDFPLKQPKLFEKESGQFWWRFNVDI